MGNYFWKLSFGLFVAPTCVCFLTLTKYWLEGSSEHWSWRKATSSGQPWLDWVLVLVEPGTIITQNVSREGLEPSSKVDQAGLSRRHCQNHVSSLVTNLFLLTIVLCWLFTIKDLRNVLEARHLYNVSSKIASRRGASWEEHLKTICIALENLSMMRGHWFSWFSLQANQ